MHPTQAARPPHGRELIAYGIGPQPQPSRSAAEPSTRRRTPPDVGGIG